MSLEIANSKQSKVREDCSDESEREFQYETDRIKHDEY